MVNRRVMVVDNELSVCAFLSDMLLDEGYEPVLWTSGAGAYAEAKRLQPVAMLLDMNMETPDAGLRVAEAMCGDPETQNIPIIIVSAEHTSCTRSTRGYGNSPAGCIPNPWT